jgi:hypothetical protein
MCTVGGHWEITGCVGSFFKLSPLESSKSSGASSGVFDISLCNLEYSFSNSDYCVARIGPTTSVYAPVGHQASLS